MTGSWATANLDFSKIDTHQLPHFAVVNDGQIYRGGQPTDEGLKFLAEQNIKTIVSLRDEWPPQIEHEKRVAQRLGLLFLNVPLSATAKPDPRDIDLIEKKILADSALYPIYVHCLLGRDRTGLVIGLYRVLVQKPGFTAVQAYGEMQTLGFHQALRNLTDFYNLQTGYHP